MEYIVWTRNNRNSLSVIKELSNIGVKYHQIKVKKFIQREQVRMLLNHSFDGFDSIIAKKSHLWQVLKDSIDDMNTKDLIELISRNPELIKLPIIFDGYCIYTGVDTTELINDLRQ